MVRNQSSAGTRRPEPPPATSRPRRAARPAPGAASTSLRAATGEAAVALPVVTPEPSAAPRRKRGAHRRSTCPVACALDIVGDRWTLLVIRDLLRGKSRFSDFLASSERIPTNILAERLKRLEQEHLIESAPYSAHPRRVEYRLTDDGRALGRAVSALGSWGLSHFPGAKPPGKPWTRASA